MSVRVGINGFGRIGRNVLPRRPGEGHRHRMGRGQRHHRQRDARPPPEVRLDPRAVPGVDRGPRRRAARRRHRDQGPRRARPRQAAVEGPRRRRRARVDRLLHRPRRRRQAPRGGGEEGRDLGARQGRGHHRRPRRQRRPVRQGEARRHLQRVVHDELPRAGRQGRSRDRRHQARPDDDDPRLHRGPAPPGRAAPRPAPRPRRRRQPRADLDRRGEGGRPRAPRAQRQAPRLRGPRAGHHGLASST